MGRGRFHRQRLFRRRPIALGAGAGADCASLDPEATSRDLVNHLRTHGYDVASLEMSLAAATNDRPR